MLLRTLLLAAVLLSLATLGSCAKKERAATKVIGVSLLNRGHIFYKDLEEGLQEQAKKEGYELIVTSADFDLGKQISQIEDFVARKVDAIILCPVDSRGVGPGVLTASQAGIPVFTADIAAENAPVVCHIASDNIAGGRLAGEYMAKLLNGAGKVAIINQPVVTSVLDRVQGFRDALSKFPGITIVADVNGQGVRDRALQAAADVLQAHQDLAGVFGINDDSALGTLDACEQFKRDKPPVIIGYDATPPAADAIKRGSALKADVVQYPKKIGSSTIDMIRAHFAGQPVPKVFPVEVGIVDQAKLSAI
ncbi:MAG: substrate-binding domain-containing protein [Ignavibacteria bacterium]|nr:substrate-binding domain-containing protein [Ignavibacteria bacterium]